MLCRGTLTKDSTLVSERFAHDFCNQLRKKGCVYHDQKKDEKEHNHGSGDHVCSLERVDI